MLSVRNNDTDQTVLLDKILFSNKTYQEGFKMNTNCNLGYFFTYGTGIKKIFDTY